MGVGVGGVVYVWSCSVAAYWGSAAVNMMSGSISPSTTPHVSCIVVGNSNVGFDFPYVACEAFVISCFNDVLDVAKEVYAYLRGLRA